MTTSRLSYASSPESDLELSPGPSASLSLGNLPQLVKSSSDPSIATNQDNLDRDRDIGEGLPPPYTHSYEHTSGSHNRRSTMDAKYNFSSSEQNTSQVVPNPSSNRPQSIYGINAPDLPPRVDRASKPPGGPPIPNAAVTSTPPRSSGGGTVGRSAQERLFGKQLTEDGQDDYVTRNSTESIDRAQNSLDRQRITNTTNSTATGKVVPTNPQNGSYDSVSSYDSYNTTQLSVQNIRLGPNAPDDLKSVPNANGRPLPPSTVGLNVMNDCRNNSNDSSVTNRNSQHEHSRGVHDHQSRGFVGSNDLNRQNSPGRPPYLDVNSQRNIDSRNPQNPLDIRSLQTAGMAVTQRSANLGLENSPRKQLMETKTDYSKYSRNNSTSQADYNKSPKSPHVVSQSGNNGIAVGNSGASGNGGGAFKPVPPPKPKNYRPPVQGQMTSSGHWDNGESNSPRSPNGFFYPPTPSHYHHSQASQGAPHTTPNNASSQPIHAYGHYNAGQAPAYPPPTNGYSGSGHGYSGQYVHRGHPSISNFPHHTPERHSLDLAGSREQRGSAFELYRKPQIGSTGHHHNMSEMEPYERYYDHFQPMHRTSYFANEMNERKYYGYYSNENPPPLPPPLPSVKIKKKSMLKSPLTVIKNVFIKSTRPLRRMNSMVEPERVIKPCLRRQYSMMERNVARAHYPPAQYVPMEVPVPRYNVRHEPFYPRDLNNTYQNLESEDIYGTCAQEYQQNCDNLYANRALIDLERRQAEVKAGSRRIVRRHSMADRTNSNRSAYISSPAYDTEYVYSREEYLVHDQRTPGSAVMSRRRFYSDRPEESIYQSRREMHRNHLYQSRKEMQERIAQGKKEIEREFSPHSSSHSTDEKEDKSDKEPVYYLRRDVKENGLKTRQQLREQIYQTRRETIESMAEPIYVSKKDVIKHEPIYETKEEGITESKESINAENKQKISSDSLTNNTLTESKHSDTHKSDETVIERTITTNVNSNVPDDELPSMSRSQRDPFHISSIIKRTAPSPAINSSRTSIETHYTSQASLPVGPPNATSTPYASEMSLPTNVSTPMMKQTLSSLQEPSTTRGIFDEIGGTLRDNVWNVSLEIPPGAIAVGIKQEIYFTVTDPRMSESVGGPPLDMENGETMLSPLVMCGPQGLEFLIPVTLNIPHCAGRTASLGLSLKATDSERNLETNWDNIDLPSNASAHTVSVKVDHF